MGLRHNHLGHFNLLITSAGPVRSLYVGFTTNRERNCFVCLSKRIFKLIKFHLGVTGYDFILLVVEDSCLKIKSTKIKVEQWRRVTIRELFLNISLEHLYQATPKAVSTLRLLFCTSQTLHFCLYQFDLGCCHPQLNCIRKCID